MKIKIIVIVSLLLSAFSLEAKPYDTPTSRLFKPLCDSIVSAYNIYLGNEKLEVTRVRTENGKIDLHFNRVLSNFPFTEKDVKDLHWLIVRNMPDKYRSLVLRNIYTNGMPVEKYAVSSPGFDGKPVYDKVFRDGIYDPNPSGDMIVERTDLPYSVTKGLQGRHIALWQSHGYYYEQSLKRWEWQRARIFQTVEDLFTQSYVIPFLVPMLENAGAYAILPRERDMNSYEAITDNDGSTGKGRFTVNGSSVTVGDGFGYRKTYKGKDNPFRCGTALKITGTAEWKPDIPKSGEYAVYVSYATITTSSPKARYRVRHSGGESEFTVNQKMGGGTWIYLGTFPFEEGVSGSVTLYSGDDGDVTADAVKFGGGMGNIERGVQDKNGNFKSETMVSGYPRWCEGARYWLQYAGYGDSLYSINRHVNDYKDDFQARGPWVGVLSGGSKSNPKENGLGIPVDLALAFHSDAGTFPNDSIIGTLVIHTRESENRSDYPNGEDRMTSRHYANYVQTQIVNDIRTLWEPEWSRRSTWDRSYYEARTPPVPSMILELQSHQNLADMRYGLDPAFRFTVSRAVYKGILKYLSARYGHEYVVQPLPVAGFSAVLSEHVDKVTLRWEPVIDEIEPTAQAKSYIVYTRIDGGAWDEGKPCSGTSYTADIEKGRIYSFKVVAANEGGISFPSEILSVGIPVGGNGRKILVVNSFDRVAPPVHFATADTSKGGFLNRADSGVPYIRDISFTGEQYEFRRSEPWRDDDNPGFGASDFEYEDKIIAGNTFDYPYIHGEALMKAGYSFMSMSRQGFCEDPSAADGCFAVDLILGKQVTTPKGRGVLGNGYRCFPVPLMDALKEYAGKGGNIIVSGAHFTTDIWNSVYDIAVDSTYRAEASAFATKVLRCEWLTNYANSKGIFYGTSLLKGIEGRYSSTPNDSIYCVESPDGIIPAKGGEVIMRYKGNNVPAATIYTGRKKATDASVAVSSAAAFGFPLETVLDREMLSEIFRKVLAAFEQ